MRARPRPHRSHAVLILTAGLTLAGAGCDDAAQKALLEQDLGFRGPDNTSDQGAYSLDPEAVGGAPGTGGAQATDGSASEPSGDAATVWEADAAPSEPPPDTGPCEEGEQRACEAENCVGGIQICHDGAFGNCSPPPEKCNDRDDDCDGQIDENFSSVGDTCSAGGDCDGMGMIVCKPDGTGVVCDLPPEAGGTPEICDGQDNDCDSVLDEDFPNERCCLRSADCGPGQTCDDTGHCEGGEPIGPDPGDPGDPGDFGFGDAPLAPPGAACATAQDIPGPGEYPGATGGNGDEGMCTFFPTGGGEAAFTLIRDVDTAVRLYAFGDFLVNTVLYVRTDCMDAFSEVACNDDTENDFLNPDAETEFVARAGQEYAIIVDSWGAGGTFTLIVDELPLDEPGPGPGPDPGPDPVEPDAGVPPPPPEAVGTCAEPIELPVEGAVDGNTRDGDSANAVACAATGGAPEAILHYRIDHPARVTFTTRGSDFDTVLAIRTTCDSTDGELACNDDNGDAGQWSAISADLNPNVDYFLVVEGFEGERGAFTLNVTEDWAEACSPDGSGCAAGEACFATACQALPEGLCAGATPLRPQIPVAGTLEAADADAVPTAGGCGGQHGSERLFAILPERDGELSISTEGSEIDTVLSLYDGCGQAIGGEIACRDDSGGSNDATIRVNGIAGRMIFAAVEGFRDGNGGFRILYQAAE